MDEVQKGHEFGERFSSGPDVTVGLSYTMILDPSDRSRPIEIGETQGSGDAGQRTPNKRVLNGTQAGVSQRLTVSVYCTSTDLEVLSVLLVLMVSPEVLRVLRVLALHLRTQSTSALTTTT